MKGSSLTVSKNTERLSRPQFPIPAPGFTAMNGVRAGTYTFTDVAYEKFREFTFAIAQLVVRETSDEERERIQSLRDIPAFLGGLGGWGPP